MRGLNVTDNPDPQNTHTGHVLYTGSKISNVSRLKRGEVRTGSSNLRNQDPMGRD